MQAVRDIIREIPFGTPANAVKAPKPKEVPMSSTSSDSDTQRKRIDRLFIKFAAFYGHIWRSQFKNDRFTEFAKGEWQDALARFDNSVIERVIHDCRERDEFPPTLPQFIHYCRQARKPESSKPLEKAINVSAPEVAHGHLRSIKQLLQDNKENASC